jgi:serine/threonine-protein kinase RsbW
MFDESIRITARTADLKKARKFILKCAGNAGFEPDSQVEIEMALDEIAANIVFHAYNNRQRKADVIEIRANQLKNGLEIIIKDSGKPFNLKEKPLPDISDYFQKNIPHGLGIFAVKKFMDDVDYEYRDGANITILRKYIKPKDNN